VKIGYR